jgi:hypothetical protein
MLVFIDDSGDAGFKLGKGSTDFFIIAMVVFDDDLEAEKVSAAIKELRHDLGWQDYREFRFYKLNREIRLKFLQKVKPFNFRIRALVVNKKIIRSDELKSKKDKFYSYFIKEALKNNGGKILDARIKIDGSGDRVFRRSFLSYLRRELNSQEKKVMKNCRMEDSQGNVLIQLADMVAGSINRSYSGKADAGDYKAVIKKHIEDEWLFK